jgi:Uma2 family endonuclease
MIDLEDLFQRADDIGIRLEIIGGLPVWERHPNMTHQLAIDRIRETITSLPSQNGRRCACFHLADLHLKFPDGSDKRPDIAIFCEVPTETESAVTQVPDAVIEIVSRGYEAKDLDLGPPFYLGQGVKDVIVFNPYDKQVIHFDRAGRREFASPVTLELKCGCQVTV